MDQPSNVDDDLDALLDNAYEDFKGLEENAHLKTDTPSNQPKQENSEANPFSTKIWEEALKSLNESAEKNGDADPDDFLNKFMQDMTGGSNYESMVEGMMKQLISKEMLYEPMKEIHEKYPEWLEKNKGKIDQKQYSNYLKQFGYIERILYIYDTKEEKDGFDEVLKLVKEMQELGQVPSEIVQQLAPEVEFDEQGLPKFKPDGMPGLPPGMDPNCTIL